MKKAYFISMFAALLAVVSACTKEGTPSVNSDVTEIEFTTEGGSRTISVSTEGLESWDVYSSASWAEIIPDFTANTITVNVAPTEDIDDKTCDVVIFSDIRQAQMISIIQKGNGIIYDRPSSKQMGFRGKVRLADFYFDPIHMWEHQPGYLYNLEFDKNGMLTYYEFTYKADIVVNFAVEVSYNNENRPVKLHAYSSDTSGEVFPSEFVIDFTYGSHGKYVNLQNLFAPIEAWNCPTFYRVWMPDALKNLTGIRLSSDFLRTYQITEDGKGINHVDIIIDTYPEDEWEGRWQAKYRSYLPKSGTDDEGNSIQVPNPEGTLYELNKYEFTGPFTTKMIYDIDFVGIIIPATVTFDLDQRNGLVYTEEIRNDEVFGQLLYKTYHSDFNNSCFRYSDDMGTYYRMDIEYNEKYDVSRLYNGSRDAYADFQYEYDEFGNWKAIECEANSLPLTMFPSTRKIKYYR